MKKMLLSKSGAAVKRRTKAAASAKLASADTKDGPLAGDANGETQLLLAAMTAFRHGDFSARLPAGWTGVYGKIADAFNEVLTMSERRARARVSRVVGREGRFKQRMTVLGLVGSWAEEIQDLNALMDDLVRPTIEVAGDRRRCQGRPRPDDGPRIDGRPLTVSSSHSAKLVNTMVDQLSVFASRGHPCRPRGGHGRETRWPGAGSRGSPAPGRTSPIG